MSTERLLRGFAAMAVIALAGCEASTTCKTQVRSDGAVVTADTTSASGQCTGTVYVDSVGTDTTGQVLYTIDSVGSDTT